MSNVKIEDYLHLYLGCELLVDEVYKGFSCKLIPLMTTSSFKNGMDLSNAIYHKAKPILRPLSDMAEEEMRKLGVLHHWNNVYQNMCRNNKRISKDTKGFRIYSEDINYDDTRIVFDSLNPSQFLYLLKQGFDLFGLIESGLAINKAKQEGEEHKQR